jgi:NTP pyrophosphatase (non-canonical NTP hydrolase)
VVKEGSGRVSFEQGISNKEHGTRNSEQETRNKEQGTRNSEQENFSKNADYQCAKQLKTHNSKSRTLLLPAITHSPFAKSRPFSILPPTILREAVSPGAGWPFVCGKVIFVGGLQSYFHFKKPEVLDDLNIIIDALIKFRDDRDWAQFHDSKNLATAIAIEAAELNELFLWKTIEDSELVDKKKIKEELADIFAFSLLLAHKHGFNVEEMILEKMRKNAEKYPIDKSKGSASKYTDL